MMMQREGGGMEQTQELSQVKSWTHSVTRKRRRVSDVEKAQT